MIDTTENFDHMGKEARNCQLHENGKKYNEINCYQEKKINEAIANCKCIPWYMKGITNGSSPVCSHENALLHKSHAIFS